MKKAITETKKPLLRLKGLLRVDIKQLDKIFAETRKREIAKAWSEMICPSVSAAGF